MTPAEKQMSILTLLIFLATAANVWVFYLESEDTSKQMKTLADKAGEIVSTMNTALSNNHDAISKAFDANKKAVEASALQSKVSLDANIKSLQLDQRAWVAAEKAEVTQFDASQPTNAFRTNITLHNTGRTPAFNLKRASGYMLSRTLAQGPNPKYIRLIEEELRAEKGSRPLVPGGTTFLESSDNGNYVIPKWVQITGGTEFVYIYGRLEYDDVAKKHHFTTFCFYLKNASAQQYASCENYNDMN